MKHNDREVIFLQWRISEICYVIILIFCQPNLAVRAYTKRKSGTQQGELQIFMNNEKYILTSSKKVLPRKNCLFVASRTEIM